MPQYPIASVWSLSVAEVAEKEFKQRFPLNIIKRTTFSAKRRRILISVIAIALIIWLAYLLYFMYQTEPIEVVTAEKKKWLAAKHSDTGTHYEIVGFDFTLPDRFTKVKEEKEWQHFEDNISKTKINVGPGLFHHATFKQRFLFDFLMGISDDYDFFRLAYTAHFGLIPTLNNAQAFKELFDIKLYEINHGELNGIVLQGMKGNKSIGEIIIVDKKHGIRFFLNQPGERGKISEELLKAIAESIQSKV